MRNMPTVFEDGNLRWPLNALHDSMREGDGTELVHVAMDRQHRTGYSGQLFVQTPVGEIRPVPDVSPCVQYPSGLITMPADELLKSLVILKLFLRHPYAGQGSLFDKRLCRFGDDSRTARRIECRDRQGNGPAHAVSEEDVSVKAERVDDRGKDRLCFASNKEGCWDV